MNDSNPQDCVAPTVDDKMPPKTATTTTSRNRTTTTTTLWTHGTTTGMECSILSVQTGSSNDDDDDDDDDCLPSFDWPSTPVHAQQQDDDDDDDDLFFFVDKNDDCSTVTAVENDWWTTTTDKLSSRQAEEEEEEHKGWTIRLLGNNWFRCFAANGSLLLKDDDYQFCDHEGREVITWVQQQQQQQIAATAVQFFIHDTNHSILVVDACDVVTVLECLVNTETEPALVPYPKSSWWQAKLMHAWNGLSIH